MKEKEPKVWIGEITFRFAIVAEDPEAAHKILLGLEGADYEDFKNRMQYRALKFVESFPLIEPPIGEKQESKA